MVTTDEVLRHTTRGASDESATGISVVLPAYNEAAVIADTVHHVEEVLRGLAADFEIIVVDDGSHDSTPDVLAELQAADPTLHLRVVRHAHNAGYGAALASGFDASTRELIFFTDGDKQFDVRELGVFLSRMTPSVDMVIGFRAKRADPPLRRVNAWGWKQLVNFLFGYTARDVDCAFKLFRGRVWRQLRVHSRGATFSAELLIKARRAGFQILELPVHHYPRPAGQATGAHPRVIARAFRELFALRLSVARELSEPTPFARAEVTARHVRP